MKRVRIGGGLGFYGDGVEPVKALVAPGGVQYIVADHLAELTLAILQKDRARDPGLGYARDLLPLLQAVYPPRTRPGVRLITNAGGLNPVAAAAAARTYFDKVGLPLTVALVTGDDLLPFLSELGELPQLHSGEPIPEQIRSRLVFANAYLGAAPVARALAGGADVVITGRVADCALSLGPLIHEFGWASDDWDRLAVGAVAGHLLECSGQASGGNYSGDWRDVADLTNIGYPIADVDETGRLVITKPAGTAGRVSVATVREQLLYEVHDPAAYLTPDVTVDLTQTELLDAGPDQVAVHGVRGHAPPEHYKLFAGYPDGWLGQGMIGYSWPDAFNKAKAAAEIIRRRATAVGFAPDALHVEYLGLDSLSGPLADTSQAHLLQEVYLRVAAHASDRAKAELISRLFPPLALSGPPGGSGMIGIDRTRELLGHWSSSVPRSMVDRRVAVNFLPPDGGAR